MNALRARPRLLLVCLALLLPPALLAIAAPGVDPPLGMDPHATSVQPHPEGGTGSEVGMFAPPLVGTDGVVVASDATAGNGASLYVAVFDARGAASYYRLTTDAAGVIHFRAPKGTVRIEVFRHFTPASKPDAAATSVVTDAAYHLEGTQPVSGAPSRGAAILEAQPVYQRGTGASDQVSMQTRDIDPRSAQLLLNGSTANVLLRAASSRSVVAQLPKTAALGASTLQARSGQATTNPVACTVIEASAPTPPPLHIGQVWPVTVHIAGLAPHTQATVTFTVSGALRIAGGVGSQTVPVRDGAATVQVQAVSAGGFSIGYEVNAPSPSFAEAGQPTAQPPCNPGGQTPCNPPPTATYQPLTHPMTTTRPGPGDRSPTPSPSPSASPSPSPSSDHGRTTSGGGNGGTTSGGAKSPGPTTTTKPTATPTATPTTPPSATPSPSPTPPCSTWVTDGWFEPTQGTWQDDTHSEFVDQPGKQLTRVSPPETTPVYDAELQMVTGRHTVLFGVDHYQYDGHLVHPEIRGHDSRFYILLRGLTTCKTTKPLHYRFELAEGSATGDLPYDNATTFAIPMEPPRIQPPQRWEAALPAPLGMPPGTSTFVFTGAGGYNLKAVLCLPDGTETDLDMFVHGKSVVTHPPTVTIVPVALTPVRGGTIKDKLDKLHADALALATLAQHRIPDFYPVAPGGLPITTNASVDLTGKSKAAEALKEFVTAASPPPADSAAARVADLIGLVTILKHSGRAIVFLNDYDYSIVAGDDSGGYAYGTKVIFIRGPGTYAVLGHELTHTIPAPPIWTDIEPKMTMAKECDHATFHNKLDKWAHGVQIVDSGTPAARRIMDTFMLMGAKRAAGSGGVVDVWINQCTYWHVLKNILTAPDPPVFLVRGYLARRGGAQSALLEPTYTLDSMLDLHPGLGSPWAIVLRDGRGATIAEFPFEPNWWLTESLRERRLISFAYRVPALPGVAQIDVRGPTGVLAHQTISKAAPSVSFVLPAAGQTLAVRNGKVHVVWTASGELGGILLATVLYAPKGSSVFEAQSIEQSGASFDVTVDGGARAHMVKVIVTDGSRSSEADVQFSTRR